MSIKIKKSKDQFQTDFIAENGELIAWTERYRNRKDAENAVLIVFRICVIYLAGLWGAARVIEMVREILDISDSGEEDAEDDLDLGFRGAAEEEFSRHGRNS